jgi:hypothetical protein
MDNAFDITTATNTIRLDDQGRGEIAFTVFNASGRALRGRARVVAEDPAAEAWLALAGEAERKFDIASAQQYTGSYPFRLDVVGVENPDAMYTQGPAVTFAVAEAEPKRAPIRWWIVAVPIGALVIIGIVLAVIFTGGGSQVDLSGFRQMAGQAPCADLANRLFVIDDQFVFWERRGNCADASFEQQLFGTTADELLCERHDSIAGPIERCPEPEFEPMFLTIVANLEQPDLGLGPERKVVQVEVHPAGGSQ